MNKADVKVGDIVCDCRFLHLRIIKIDDDDAMLEDGISCSITHCLDEYDHDWPHPSDVDSQPA